MSGYLPGKRGWAKRRTRKAFVAAAATLLKQKEFFDISVIDICDQAGIPRATFYNYFEDKYDLVRMAAFDLVERLGEYKAPENAKDKEIVTDLISITLRTCKSQRDVLPAFFPVGGLVTDAMINALSQKLLPVKKDKLESDLAASEIAYGAKWWAEGGYVLEEDFMKKRLLSLLGYVD